MDDEEKSHEISFGPDDMVAGGEFVGAIGPQYPDGYRSVPLTFKLHASARVEHVPDADAPGGYIRKHVLYPERYATILLDVQSALKLAAALELSLSDLVTRPAPGPEAGGLTDLEYCDVKRRVAASVKAGPLLRTPRQVDLVNRDLVALVAEVERLRGLVGEST